MAIEAVHVYGLRRLHTNKLVFRPKNNKGSERKPVPMIYCTLIGAAIACSHLRKAGQEEARPVRLKLVEAEDEEI